MLAVFLRSSPFYVSHLATFSLIGISMIFGAEWMVPAMAVLTPVWLSSSVGFSEAGESYGFLRTLPVSDREIVRAKFGLALLAACCYWALMVAAALVLDANAGWPLGPTLLLIHLSVVASLLLAGCWYIGIWLFGLRIMSWIIAPVASLMILAGIIARVLTGQRRWVFAEDSLFTRLGETVSWSAYAVAATCLVVLGLVLYGAQMLLAVRAKQASEAHL